MELTITDEMLKIWQATLAKLSRAERRLFMASVVKAQGRGGALLVQQNLGGDGTTVRKGLRELTGGFVCKDAVHLRGRTELTHIAVRRAGRGGR